MTTTPTTIEQPPAPAPAIKPLSLRKNFAWTLAGNVVYAGSSWAMLVVLAKLGTPEIVGVFSLGLAVTAPVIMLTNLQLRAIQATDAKDEYQFSDYLGLRLLMTLAALLIIVLIAAFSGYSRETTLVILIIATGKAFDAISDVYYGLLQRYEKMDRIARSMMVKGILSLALLAGGLAATGSILWATVGWSAASALVTVFYDISSEQRTLRQVRSLPRWCWPTLRRLALLALPLGVTVMLISLNSNIPRYFLERHSGAREVGIYSAMAYLMVIGSTLIGALGQSASPRLAIHFATGKQERFTGLLLRLFGLGVGLGVAGVLIALLAGKPLLTLVYGPEYGEYTNVFVLLMVAAGISYVASFAGYGLTATRRFKGQPVIFAMCAAVTLLASALLIPQTNIEGASLVGVIAAVTQFLLLGGYLIITTRYFKGSS